MTTTGVGRRRDERGQATSVLVLLVTTVLLLLAGLVIDGGAQAAANRRAESVAQGAARSATDASSTARVSGRDGTTDALAAARAFVAGAPGIQADVSYRGGVLLIDTRTSAPTSFLSVLGVHELPARGHAEAQLTPRG